MAAFIHGKMGNLRSIQQEFLSLVPYALFLYIQAEVLFNIPVPCCNYCRYIGLASTTGETSVGAFLVSKEVQETMDHGLLHFSGCRPLVPAIHTVIECRYKKLRAYGFQESWRVEMGHIGNGPGSQKVWKNSLLHLFQGFIKTNSLIREKTQLLYSVPQHIWIDA